MDESLRFIKVYLICNMSTTINMLTLVENIGLPNRSVFQAKIKLRIKLEKEYSEGKIIYKEQNRLHGHHGRTRRHQSTSNKISLTNFKNYQYYAKVKFGSNDQEYKMIFDTGSSMSWIPKKYSGENTCAMKYKQFNSTTFQDLKTEVKITYVKGKVTVRLGSDSVTIGNMTIRNQTFGLAIKSDCEMKEYEGIIGMSLDSFSQSSLIQNMLSQGLIKEPIFAFYLNRNDSNTDSELTIGGYNEKYRKNNQLNTVEVTDPEDWQIPMEHVMFGKHIIAQGQKAIIDSGSSIIAAPSRFCQSILNIISKSNVAGVRYKNGFLLFPKNESLKLPNVSFILGNNLYTLTHKDYTIEIDEDNAIGIFFDDNLVDTWLLGDSFFQKYYIIFDYAKRTISFPKTRSVVPYAMASRGNFMNNKRREELITYIFMYSISIYTYLRYTCL